MKNSFCKSLVKSCVLTLLTSGAFFSSAVAQYSQASWWFGVAGAANYNMYRGTNDQLGGGMKSSAAFHEGNGVGLFAGPVLEYHRARSVFGFMLQAGYDGRHADYDQVTNAANRTEDLTTKLSYITVEPSLRIAPFRSDFYLYLGPRVAFNVNKSFTYTLGPDPVLPGSTATEVKGDLDDIRSTVFSGQVGIGYDIWLTSKSSRSQVVLSPFVAYQPRFGQSPRSDDSWEVSTVRGGLALKFGSGHKTETAPPPPPTPVVVLDRDGDGVLDAEDRCPDVPGLASLKGCPDKDGDGIADIDDKCPDVFGYARYQGCPIPDRDKDGINDEEDKCPDVFGYARYQGCPIPDTDKDGVNDEEDKCINVPGPASNYGCPVIPEAIISKVNSAAKNVFFSTGSAKLLPKSFGSLKTVAQILTDNPTYKISVEGHTDSTGNHDKNMTLSNDRAASVAEYLKSAGVDASRISSVGYGPDRPIAPNKTSAGRAKNRRVEMKLTNY